MASAQARRDLEDAFDGITSALDQLYDDEDLLRGQLLSVQTLLDSVLENADLFDGDDDSSQPVDDPDGPQAT